MFKEHPGACSFLKLAAQAEKVVRCTKKFHVRDCWYFDSRHRIKKPHREVEAPLYYCRRVRDDRRRSSERHARQVSRIDYRMNKAYPAGAMCNSVQTATQFRCLLPQFWLIVWNTQQILALGN